jgi:subtilisin-like proprotein convertase family protein
LSVFNGAGSPNGAWTISITDLSGGDAATLGNWGLELTGVPEPSTYASIFGIMALGFAVYYRKFRKQAAA